MSKYCLICECEPVDDSDWYYCEKTTESVCPWCVKDMIDAKIKEDFIRKQLLDGLGKEVK